MLQVHVCVCTVFSSVQKLIALRNMMALDSPFSTSTDQYTMYRHSEESNWYLHAGVTFPEVTLLN